MRRSEYWSLRYRQRPYLHHTPDSELNKRFLDVLKNTLTLTSNGQIGCVGREGLLWHELNTHLFCEFGRRGGIPSGLTPPRDIPKATFPSEPRAVSALRRISYDFPSSHLIKFGKKDHMEALYRDGVVMINPAGVYADPSLNSSIHDDELCLDVVIPPCDVAFSVDVADALRQKFIMKPGGNVRVNVSSKDNYYVYCMASRLDLRLFDDFEYDACVIVTQPAAFRKRLCAAAGKVLNGFVERDQTIQYVDPYNCSISNVDICFSKYFGYSYQKEYRFAWVPKEPVRSPISPVFVSLGSLEGIAHFVCV